MENNETQKESMEAEVLKVKYEYSPATLRDKGELILSKIKEYFPQIQDLKIVKGKSVEFTQGGGITPEHIWWVIYGVANDLIK